MTDTLFLLLWLCPAFITLCVAFGAINDNEPMWGALFCAVTIVPFASLFAVAVGALYGLLALAGHVLWKAWRK